LTLVVKFPFASALMPPETCDGWSQYRLVDSFARNAEPLTVITVFASPAVTSREMNALTGVGVGEGDGDGDGDGDGAGVGVVVGKELGVGVGEAAAIRRNHRGRVANTRMPLIEARRLPVT
jgi:hypothetical protein